ncbi:hypothetical protein K3495_g8102 [Podosphaera aphanis]|nr:hypothetical protein K3495_g8102 [Podosphaera aphanis]
MNTNKNFIIYYPHWTTTQGWKWTENFTPHASFNEDIMFGDELTPVDQQKTTSYWAHDNSIFSETTSHNHNPPSTLEFQDLASFEGEHIQPKSENPPTKHQELYDYEPVVNTKEPRVEEKQAPFLLSVEQSLLIDAENVSSQNSEQGSPTPTESHHSELTLNDLSEQYPDQGSQDPIFIPDNQGESSSEEDSDEVFYDQIMPSWDPIRHIAGKKRTHSPEAECSEEHTPGDDSEETPYY